jgi:nucleotide-binding universal stress UspA family protein
MLKRILVGLGGGDYTKTAIDHAIALAASHGAELTGAVAIDDRRLSSVGPVPLGASRYAHDLVESRLQKLESHVAEAVELFTGACVGAGVRHQLLREHGEPLSVMIDQARYHDLMVFGLRSLFELDLVDEPHDALVRLVSSGVRPLLAASRHFRDVNKVLIAYSGSMESAKAMKRFVQLRPFQPAALRIVSFVNGHGSARQLVEDAATYCKAHGLEAEVDTAAGPPKQALLPYAEDWGADLIVVGNSARKLLLRRILGETALHVIQRSELPLFLAQ